MFITKFEGIRLTKKESDYLRKFLMNGKLKEPDRDNQTGLLFCSLKRKHLEYHWETSVVLPEKLEEAPFDDCCPVKVDFKCFVEESFDRKFRIFDWRWRIDVISSLGGVVDDEDNPHEKFRGRGEWSYDPQKDQLLFEYSGQAEYSYCGDKDIIEQEWSQSEQKMIERRYPSIHDINISFKIQFLIQLTK